MKTVPVTFGQITFPKGAYKDDPKGYDVGNQVIEKERQGLTVETIRILPFSEESAAQFEQRFLYFLIDNADNKGDLKCLNALLKKATLITKKLNDPRINQVSQCFPALKSQHGQVALLRVSSHNEKNGVYLVTGDEVDKFKELTAKAGFTMRPGIHYLG